MHGHVHGILNLRRYYYYVNKISFCTQYLFWTTMLNTNTAAVVPEDKIKEW